MAFGDEVTESVGNVGGRTSAQGYGEEDEIRKGYTGYERDDESGLDFAQARYYNSMHGRFTSVDPLTASANVKNPQTFNRYSYVLNSPYKFVDPLGLVSSNTAACGNWCSNRGDASGGWVSQYQLFENSGTVGMIMMRQAQSQRLIYIFITLPTSELSKTESDGTKTYDFNGAFRKLKQNVPKGTQVKVYTNEFGIDKKNLWNNTDGLPTIENFKAALRDPNAAAVIFYGHSYGGTPPALGDENYVHQAEGLTFFDSTEGYEQSNKETDIKAQSVIVITCDGAGAANLFQPSETTIIASNAGKNGLSKRVQGINATLVVAKEIIKGSSTTRIVSAANSAYTKSYIYKNFKYSSDKKDGDKIEKIQ